MRYLKAILALTILSVALLSFKSIKTSNSFDDYPVYNGNDLGVSYSPSKTLFKIWAPTASAVKLRLYAAGDGGAPTQTIQLNKGDQGVWKLTINQDLKDQYYTLQANVNGKWLQERPDIYAKAVGINGKRGMVVDLASTNPKDWNNDKKPALKNFTDILIYELHIRDLSISPNSGIQHKGQFLGLTEIGTKSPEGELTGLDHIKSLGVTHVHLLPSFDFNSIDEAKPT